MGRWKDDTGQGSADVGNMQICICSYTFPFFSGWLNVTPVRIWTFKALWQCSHEIQIAGSRGITERCYSTTNSDNIFVYIMPYGSKSTFPFELCKTGLINTCPREEEIKVSGTAVRREEGSHCGDGGSLRQLAIEELVQVGHLHDHRHHPLCPGFLMPDPVLFPPPPRPGEFLSLTAWRFHKPGLRFCETCGEVLRAAVFLNDQQVAGVNPVPKSIPVMIQLVIWKVTAENIQYDRK